MNNPESLFTKFWRYVSRGNSVNCWLWTGYVTTVGYGAIGIGANKELGDKHSITAHRAAWTLMRGPVPSHLQIDHLCRNKLCVNPHHLQPVTPAVNLLRGTAPAALNAKKTHCKWGHEFTPANIYMSPRGRNCRMCAVLHNRKLRRERKEQSKTINPVANGFEIVLVEKERPE